jgi:hypothetical protein
MEPKYTERSGAIDFYFLVAEHLRNISDGLKIGLETTSTKNTVSLMSYFMQVKHYENMITMFLPEYYWNKKKEIFPNIPPISSTWTGIDKNMEFFEEVSKWFQLIHTTAYNEGVLKIKRPIRPDKAGKVYKNGFQPADYNKS